jgi:acetyl-CoA synthetase
VKRYGLDLRIIISGGESVGKELHEWSAGALGAPINEMFGQTECNLVLGSNGNKKPVKPASLGRAIPGHIAGIVDDAGQPLPAGTIGNLAFRSPDPVMLLDTGKTPRQPATNTPTAG